MSATAEPLPAGPPPSPYVGVAPPSPAGPAGDAFDTLRPAPWAPGPHRLHLVRFNQRQAAFVSRADREVGEVFRMRGTIRGNPTITSHPDHVRSLFMAKAHEAVSITGESPLRPIVGPNSTLTAIGPRHLRQRKLMLPPFHGEAVERYSQMISDAADREIDTWPVGEAIRLAPRMQAITLDVIMAGIFGVEGEPERGTPEWGLRETVKRLVDASTWPAAQAFELFMIGKDEPTGFLKWALKPLDHYTYAVIRARRADASSSQRGDILSILLEARTEEGELLTDQELRDELLTLVLAGHETTANSLSWTWERLVRNPDAYERLREATRGGADSADVVEATIVEGMRNRPVIPIIGRRVLVPWRLGEYGVKADRPIAMSILLVHHREDLYPDPFSFRPERWLGGRKPGTYEWIPFGGGIRRCLGAALAMAEQRVVLEAMSRRLDLEYVDAAPEKAVHRNVTMIPADGARVVVRDKRPA